MSIRDRLLEIGGWMEVAGFDGNPVFKRSNRLLVTIHEHHLFVDEIDSRVRDALAVTPSVVVYVSKHRAASGQDSLTVHPIGNWHDAEFGGRAGVIVPSAPGLMTDALRRVAANARGLGYAVTFESTHHGPFLGTPTFYVEVGSSERAWADRDAARALALAVIEARDPGFPVALGIGGGHYVPRVTDVALARRVSFGHLIPSHALEPPNWDAIGRALEGTPGAKFAYFHRKALPKPIFRELERFFRERGVEPAREADFPPLHESAPQSI